MGWDDIKPPGGGLFLKLKPGESATVAFYDDEPPPKRYSRVWDQGLRKFRDPVDTDAAGDIKEFGIKACVVLVERDDAEPELRPMLLDRSLSWWYKLGQYRHKAPIARTWWTVGCSTRADGKAEQTIAPSLRIGAADLARIAATEPPEIR